MILPRLRWIMPGTKALASSQGARRLTAMVWSQSAILASSSGSIRAMPALLTRMSMVPNAASASLAARSGPSVVAMSAAIATQRRPLVSTAFFTSAKPSRSRPTAAMSAPASARTLQASMPMPLVAPVTSAVLPSNPKRLIQSDIVVLPTSCAASVRPWRRPSGRHSARCAGSAPGRPAGSHPSRRSTRRR